MYFGGKDEVALEVRTALGPGGDFVCFVPSAPSSAMIDTDRHVLQAGFMGCCPVSWAAAPCLYTLTYSLMCAHRTFQSTLQAAGLFDACKCAEARQSSADQCHKKRSICCCSDVVSGAAGKPVG